MKRLIRWIFSWAHGEAPTTDDSPRPLYRDRTVSFILVQADNGWLVESYDVSQDKTRRRIVEEGQTIGDAVDAILVESRLTK